MCEVRCEEGARLIAHHILGGLEIHRLLPSPALVRLRYFVKIGHTEMGQCAAVVCRKWD